MLTQYISASLLQQRNTFALAMDSSGRNIAWNFTGMTTALCPLFPFSFNVEICTVAEVVHRRANVIENSPGVRPHRSGTFQVQRAPLPELALKVPREASSLKLLREKVRRRPWTTNFPQRVRRTLGVATPHKGEHSKGETGSES